MFSVFGLGTWLKDVREGYTARIDKYGTLRTAREVPELPKAGTENREQWWRSSITGMNVDGSITPQKFSVNANKDYDIHITDIIIALETPSINEEDFYENSGDLPVGWDLLVNESGTLTPLIDKAKTLGDIMIQAGIIGKEKKINTSANTEIGFYLFNLSEKVPGGLRLGRGTRDNITSIINDDLSVNAMLDFYIYYIGYKRLP